MPSSADKDGMPAKDPYRVLGIPATASQTDIKRAYRQLALKLHPDKQTGSLADSEREALDRQFHDVKDARSFLLDPEHAEARKKYDADLASQRVRHAEEERRERTMSARRKRMRDELKMRENMARSAPTAPSSRGAGAAPPSSGKDRFDVERLRREGERLREEYSRREAEVDSARERRIAVERATKKLEAEDRQVRLKWLRKKVVGGVHTKQSLTSIMKEFGEVEEVEMLGSKGNTALITFANASSCKYCVDAYGSSKAMRATYVGRRKVDDTMRGDPVRETDHVKPGAHDSESLEERKLRQASERERLMRQMELEDAGGDTVPSKASMKWSTINQQDKAGERSSFPPNFPDEPENKGLSPFELLEKYEKMTWKD